VVGGFGGNFTQTHGFFTTYVNGVCEPLDVPELKEGDVQTDVRWIQGIFVNHAFEEACKVLDVIHRLKLSCLLFMFPLSKASMPLAL
jgi:hypothetical protein